MILVNEFMGTNPKNGNPNQCTWQCHDDTSFCKTNHVKFLTPYIKTVDPFYFGVINGLKDTGNYVWGNIIFLVVIVPMMIYFLLIRVLDLRLEIKNIKNRNGKAV